jgi:hypothetical protein
VTRTGMSFRSRPPITDTDTILAPPNGIPIRARPASVRSMLAFAETRTTASAPATASAASTTAAITRQARPLGPRVSDDFGAGGAGVGGAGLGVGAGGRSVGGAGVSRRKVDGGGVGGSTGARSGENVAMLLALRVVVRRLVAAQSALRERKEPSARRAMRILIRPDGPRTSEPTAINPVTAGTAPEFQAWDRIGRNASRRLRASSSGSATAGKWPPVGCSAQDVTL